MYCSKCGKELKEDEKFCNQCGTPVTTNGEESIKDFTNKVKSFWNKAKETCVEAYKSAMPKIPTFEIEFNEESEKLLQKIGYKWFYSSKNGEKLRLYKYYTDGTSIAKIEIDTFPNSLADIYIKFNHDKIRILSQIIYDFVRLRNYIYVRYQGSSDTTKFAIFSSLNNIVDNNETEKIDIEALEFNINLSRDMYQELKTQGYVEECTYANDGYVITKLKKNELEFLSVFSSREKLDNSQNFKAEIKINAMKNILNANNNNAFETILKILELRNYIDVYTSEYKKSGNIKGKNMTLSDFISKSNFDFQWIGEYEYASAKEFAEIYSKPIPKHYQNLIYDDMDYNKDLGNDRKKKRL